MNESGHSVAPALRFYKLPPERLSSSTTSSTELGDVRAKTGRRAGRAQRPALAGRAIGTQDFLRVRGSEIGRPCWATAGRWSTARPPPPGTDVDRPRGGADCAPSGLRDGWTWRCVRGTGADPLAPTPRCADASPRRRPRVRRLDDVRAVVRPLLERAAQILAAQRALEISRPAHPQAAHHLRRLVQPRAHLVFAHSARVPHRAQHPFDGRRPLPTRRRAARFQSQEDLRPLRTPIRFRTHLRWVSGWWPDARAWMDVSVPRHQRGHHRDRAAAAHRERARAGGPLDRVSRWQLPGRPAGRTPNARRPGVSSRRMLPGGRPRPSPPDLCRAAGSCPGATHSDSDASASVPCWS